MWNKALDAAHAVKDLWGKTATCLALVPSWLKIADKMEENLELLALPKLLDTANRFVRARAADFLSPSITSVYFAGCIRAEEGTVSEIGQRHHRLSISRSRWVLSVRFHPLEFSPC